jgi:hypothetical protein
VTANACGPSVTIHAVYGSTMYRRTYASSAKQSIIGEVSITHRGTEPHPDDTDDKAQREPAVPPELVTLAPYPAIVCR